MQPILERNSGVLQICEEESGLLKLLRETFRKKGRQSVLGKLSFLTSGMFSNSSVKLVFSDGP